jgi:hypothetical protein
LRRRLQKAIAVVLPIPEVPPVTSTILLVYEFCIASFVVCVGNLRASDRYSKIV